MLCVPGSGGVGGLRGGGQTAAYGHMPQGQMATRAGLTVACMTRGGLGLWAKPWACCPAQVRSVGRCDCCAHSFLSTERALCCLRMGDVHRVEWGRHQTCTWQTWRCHAACPLLFNLYGRTPTTACCRH